MTTLAKSFGRQTEMFLKGDAQPLIAGETGPADDVFDGYIRFPEQKSGARESAAMNLVEQGCAGAGIEAALESTPVDAHMLGHIGNSDPVVALAPDVVHCGVNDGVADALRLWASVFRSASNPWVSLAYALSAMFSESMGAAVSDSIALCAYVARSVLESKPTEFS